MARHHDPVQQLKEARQIAKDYNMFITEKGDRFNVFRITPSRPVYLGSRGTPGTLRSFVEHCAYGKKAAR